MSYQAVVGLGNPGGMYDATRHNSGFAVVDLLLHVAQRIEQGAIRLPPLSHSAGITEAIAVVSAEAAALVASAVRGDFDLAGWSDRGGYLESRASCGGWRGSLIKPRTFMNRSGEPLGTFMRFHKVPIGHIVVAHDEIDIPFGAVRVKVGGGEGGHNGLRSISQLCGGSGYTRIRVGVGKPPEGSELNRRDDGVATWVLKKYSGEELKVAEATVVKGLGALLSVLWEGSTKAQNRWNS